MTQRRIRGRIFCPYSQILYNFFFFYIDGASGEHQTDYEYDEAAFKAGTCGLDRANGKMFDDGYGYVTTTNYPGIPIFYSGTTIPGSCGFCPEEKGFCWIPRKNWSASILNMIKIKRAPKQFSLFSKTYISINYLFSKYLLFRF